jgi:Co/Zn/Cd efflux system component
MPTSGLRRAVLVVAVLNLGYFAIELLMALRIGSVSLLADSVDFFEDAAVNLLIFAAIGWSVARRAQVGMLLAGVMLMPAAAFLWTLWEKLSDPAPPEPFALGLTGLGALAVNLFCAFLLARHRAHPGGLAKAAFLSARNDALANVAIVAAGVVTAAQPSIWPVVLVGLGIAWLNLDAAQQVWRAARAEGREAQP